MNLKRLWALFIARNREFYRDRAAFGWNFLFPFLLVIGFAAIFGGKTHTEYKVGLFPITHISATETTAVKDPNIPERFKETRYIQFIEFETAEEGFDKLKHHKVDFLLEVGTSPHKYWINDASPKSYVVEKMFLAALAEKEVSSMAKKQKIAGREIRYITWLFPGILGMNMMFSALWGVGFVVVRYRKNGALKRLNATPLTAIEYLTAQMLSRIFLLIFSFIIVWFGCDFIFSFEIEGSFWDILIVFSIGSLSLTGLGLILAARGTSEEYTTGALNFISWPMMFLSEVWFSLEGSPEWVQSIAKIFPLTHMLTAVRRIMNDGATLIDVGFEIAILSLMTVLFLTVSALMFSWNK